MDNGIRAPFFSMSIPIVTENDDRNGLKCYGTSTFGNTISTAYSIKKKYIANSSVKITIVFGGLYLIY